MLRMAMQSGIMLRVIPQFLAFLQWPLTQLMPLAWACGTGRWEAGFEPAISGSVTTFTTLHFFTT
jgi:hypothetical protein